MLPSYTIDSAAKAGNGLVTRLGAVSSSAGSIRSLTDLAKPTRIEPLVLMDRTLQNLPVMEDVMKMCMSSYTALYMQAVSLLMGVGRIDTLATLDALNPNRSFDKAPTAVMSAEAYDEGLPSLESFTQVLPRGMVFSMEALGDQEQKDGSVAPIKHEKVEDNSGVGLANDNTNNKLYENESLAVGRMFNIELRDGNQKAKVPMTIRLVPVAVNPQVCIDIFSAGGRDSFGTRYMLAKAGLIHPIKDLIFGVDLLKRHRAALMTDTSGAYKEITDRRSNNLQKTLATGKISLNDASNIAVISSDTAKELGRKLHGSVSSPKVRQAIFDNSYLMMLVVINERFERVEVYYRDMDLVNDYSYREIKSMEKNKGPDVTELFKTFHQALGSNI